MSKILVSGLANIETTCKINQFPINYSPVEYNFFGVNSAPSGVGINISLALKALGDDVNFVSLIGEDFEGDFVLQLLRQNNIVTDYVVRSGKTASSVILYDESGKRKIYCDLKDIQEKEYEESLFKKALKDSDAVILSNINFSRKFLLLTKKLNKKIITDVHCISDIDDEYNKDFIEYSDIVFLSNENIIGREKQFVSDLAARYDCEIFICGMGDKGALIYQRDTNTFDFVDACHDYKVVNTIGAGDALLSAFVHFYIKGETAVDSLKLANRFAAKKISSVSASDGFSTEDQLLKDI